VKEGRKEEEREGGREGGKKSGERGRAGRKERRKGRIYSGKHSHSAILQLRLGEIITFHTGTQRTVAPYSYSWDNLCSAVRESCPLPSIAPECPPDIKTCPMLTTPFSNGK
jgi:hypothetical protein